MTDTERVRAMIEKLRENARWSRVEGNGTAAPIADLDAAALESILADALRYRWLTDARRLYLGPIVGTRNGKGGQRYIIGDVHAGVPRNIETLDAAIDAARAAQGEG
jgi:hypothetical protein